MRNVALSMILFSLLGELSGQECTILNGKLTCSGWDFMPWFDSSHFGASLVDLSENSIKWVPSESFKDFTKIQYVNLSRNAIQRIDRGAFQDNNYEWIDLSHNKLTTLAREVFPDDGILEKKLLNVYFHDNPWDCTCALKWLVDNIKETVVRPMLVQPGCYTPNSVKGKQLTLLEDDDYCVLQECLECDDAASCKINGSIYQCICKPKYTGDGKFCTDVNECTSSPNVCKPNEDCENFFGGYRCACSVGFEQRDGKCRDINECEPPPIGCGPGQGQCINTVGSYKCLCHPGLKYVKGQGCKDIDECHGDVDPCKDVAHSSCINTPVLDIADQGFDCKCHDGYVKSGEACIKQDDSNTLMYMGGGLGGLTGLIVILIIAFLLRGRLRKPGETNQVNFMMAPVSTAAPIEFSFLDMPQERGGFVEKDEWKDDDSDDF